MHYELFRNFARKTHKLQVMKRILMLLIVVVATTISYAKGAPLKPRLVVCTDIAPADVEPDDMESMVRLMAYADMYEIEGEWFGCPLPSEECKIGNEIQACHLPYGTAC